MEKTTAVDVQRLHGNVRWALKNGLEARELVPMLERLLRCAPRGSKESLFAKVELAELLVRESPWRAARLARDVIETVDDDRAWGVLGIAHTLMGNFRAARRAHSRALALDPSSVSHAHNLGHLIDVGLGRPAQALRWLSLAHHAVPDEPEVAASYAHALLRVNRRLDAFRVLDRSLGSSEEAEALIDKWQTAKTASCDPAP